MRPRSGGKSPEEIAAAEAAFIDGAAAEEREPMKALEGKTSHPPAEPAPVDVYDLVHPVRWPLHEQHAPILTAGSSKLDKPFIMRLKEDFWNSVDVHCRALGVSKSVWVREAMSRLMYEEQQFFLEERRGQK